MEFEDRIREAAYRIVENARKSGTFFDDPAVNTLINKESKLKNAKVSGGTSFDRATESRKRMEEDSPGITQNMSPIDSGETGRQQTGKGRHPGKIKDKNPDGGTSSGDTAHATPHADVGGTAGKRDQSTTRKRIRERIKNNHPNASKAKVHRMVHKKTKSRMKNKSEVTSDSSGDTVVINGTSMTQAQADTYNETHGYS